MKILLSIHPKFVEKILTGKKRFEFRKSLPTKDVDSVVIYATKPVGKVVAEFKVRSIHSKSPEQLWLETKNYAGIDEGFFFQYFNNREIAHAFEVGELIVFEQPKELKEFVPSGVPPQSFCYIK
jgi:prophage protein